MNLEYGVMHHDLDGLHRGPMTLEAAEDWIRRAEEGGFKSGVWLLAARQVTDWSPILIARGVPGVYPENGEGS